MAALVLIFWLAMMRASFGLIAPRNGSVIAWLCSAVPLSIAGTLYPIVQMEQPYTGLIKIWSAPVRAAFDQLGQQRRTIGGVTIAP
ncbi:MAG TPA: hypothetical protein VLJ17_11400 [Xanthobacteraceae bacterium]|nr:hypothetical protein [Xanthobacteraceae bacterium]